MKSLQYKKINSTVQKKYNIKLSYTYFLASATFSGIMLSPPMPLGVLASKVSERRRDHAAQILSHEEHDSVHFSFLILGAS